MVLQVLGSFPPTWETSKKLLTLGPVLAIAGFSEISQQREDSTLSLSLVLTLSLLLRYSAFRHTAKARAVYTEEDR